ncbi:MAG: Na+/H+ antiporter NhaA, partial [Bacteroidaceae bacterium]|nr:Na+/H+ antiporter NhaA [Bacteroidaceae bacterium]
RELLCGELSSIKKALLPVIGACGGMLVPVIVFLLVPKADPIMNRGMAIPMATDIAFSLGVISMFDKRVPVGLKIFLAALAVADDLGGIIVIAIKYTDHLETNFLLGALFFVAVLIAGNYCNVRTKAFYFSFGLMLWYCMLNSGIHATISGVILAFCVPANLKRGTKVYIERIRKALNYFPIIEVTDADRKKPAMLSDEDIQILKTVESNSDRLISPLQDMEDILKIPISIYIIPIFAFANAGVDFSGMSVMSLFSGVGLSVFLGLLIGKFVGVFSFSWLAIHLHIVQMPKLATWSSFASVCMLCGIGFTVSMFMAELSYNTPSIPRELQIELLNDAKLGILCGTIASALVGSMLLNLTLPAPQTENKE